MTKFAVVLAVALIAVCVQSSPVDVVPEPATELLPPHEGPPPLFTDLQPPPLPTDLERHTAILFVINIVSVKNATGEESNEILHDDVLEEAYPIVEPLALFLLIVEDDNETNPVSLDEVARDLEGEGFTVDKILKDNETRIIKVNMDSMEEPVAEESAQPEKSDKSAEKEDSSVEVMSESNPRLLKVRRRRSACLSCLVNKGHHGGGHHGGHGGGFYGGGGYGGGYNAVPVAVVPIAVVPIGGGGGGHRGFQGGYGGYGGHGGGGHGGRGGYYPQQQQPGYYPQYGGGYPQGGGSYSQASAQASSQSFGRK